MIDQEATMEKPETKKRKAIKKTFLFLAVFVLGMLFLAACTRAFTSDSDKANQMYAAMYGQDTADDSTTNTLFTENGEFSDRGKQVLQTLNSTTTNASGIALPNETFFKYVSMGYTIDFGTLTNNVPSITPILPDFGAGTTINLPDGLSKPQKWLNDNLLGASPTLSEADQTRVFGEEIVHSLKSGEKRQGNGWTTLNFADEQDKIYFLNTFQSAKAITLFAGYDSENNEARLSLWKNMNEWVYTARADLGIQNAPADGFVTYYQQSLNTAIATNRAGLNTSGNGGMYGQPGNQIYIQNKSWGEAFAQYGFLEGLLVWPIGWLINTFDTAFGGAGTGWAEFWAIFLVTVIVRSVLVVTSIFTTRTQNRVAELQPEVAKIQSRYPDAQTDLNEKRAMSREVNALYKKHKLKPWLQYVVLVLQFPIFICVWAALEGSATLSSGNFFGVELTSRMNDVILNSSGTIQIGPRVLACVMLGLMFIGQYLAMSTGQWFSKWKTKRFLTGLAKPVTNNGAMDPAKMTKWMNIIMMVFMVFMGVTLPAAMSMYWFFGALISIVQVFITEAISAGYRHRKTKDGDSLSAIRRSKHHESIRRSR